MVSYVFAFILGTSFLLPNKCAFGQSDSVTYNQFDYQGEQYKTSFFKNPKFLFNFDARNSFIADKDAKIGGFKIGVEFNKFLRIGLAAYGLDPPLYPRELRNKGLSNEYVINYRVNFNYLGVFSEFVLLQSGRWEFSLPIIYGAGSTSLYFLDANQKWEMAKEIKVRLIEVTLIGHFKAWSWIGLGAGVGFRDVNANEGLIDQVFDSYIYIVKVMFFMPPIIDFFTPKRWMKEPTEEEMLNEEIGRF